MAPQPLTDEQLEQAATAYRAAFFNVSNAARALGIPRTTLRSRLEQAARRGLLMDTPAAMPGFRISQVSEGPDGRRSVQQRPAHGGPAEVPEGHIVKGVSTLVDADGNTIVEWRKTALDTARSEERAKAILDGLRDQITPAAAAAPPGSPLLEDLLCQYTITDHHLGALAWKAETRNGDYDLTIGERLILDWFRMAVECSPRSRYALFAQLGDFLHYDSFKALTPEHGNLLDGDSRFPKMVRTAIRVVRQVIQMLLEKHEFVHVIMADANHDPGAEVWLREWLAVFYENEPRVTVDTSPSTYVCYEFGEVSLFYHHGHKRGPDKDVDSVFAGLFRDLYGRTKYSYAHIGHRHSDKLLSTPLMKIEQHETLAAPDAYAANGGYLSGRSAKVIQYHRRRGYVGSQIYTAEMVMEGWE